jgi:hypothetical protein
MILIIYATRFGIIIRAAFSAVEILRNVGFITAFRFIIESGSEISEVFVQNDFTVFLGIKPSMAGQYDSIITGDDILTAFLIKNTL